MPLLDRLRSIGAPRLSLGVESRKAALGSAERVLCVVLTTAVLTAARPTAREALLALRGQLLRDLLERNANLLRDGALDGELLCNLSEQREDLLRRIVLREETLRQLTVQLRVEGERILLELALREWIVAQSRLCEVLQSRLQSGKLGHHPLLGIR